MPLKVHNLIQLAFNEIIWQYQLICQEIISRAYVIKTTGAYIAWLVQYRKPGNNQRAGEILVIGKLLAGICNNTNRKIIDRECVIMLRDK